MEVKICRAPFAGRAGARQKILTHTVVARGELMSLPPRQKNQRAAAAAAAAAAVVAEDSTSALSTIKYAYDKGEGSDDEDDDYAPTGDSAASASACAPSTAPTRASTRRRASSVVSPAAATLLPQPLPLQSDAASSEQQPGQPPPLDANGEDVQPHANAASVDSNPTSAPMVDDSASVLIYGALIFSPRVAHYHVA